MRSEFLPLSRPYINETEIAAVAEVLKSGYLTTGPKVSEFEEGIVKYLGGARYAVALNSCTAGLYLSLLACGVRAGDEVIIPTWTFAATGHVVLWLGAKPVLCDVQDSSLNIDPLKLEALITAKTKAIIPVHFAGYPCQLDEITEIARKYKIVVIEDAAHAMGTEYKGRKIGSFGEICVYSFYATKNLACGEGGMVVSGNQELIERARKLSYFGINKQAFSRYTEKGSWYYEIEELGYKYNMDSIHAAIGLAQLEKLTWMNERRRQIAGMYKKGLDKRIRFGEDLPQNYHTYHLFPIRVDKGIISRDELVNKLKERKIGTSVHFIPLHKHPYYRSLLGPQSFPVADRAYEEIVSIPMFAGMPDEDVAYVIDNINEILRNGG
jgi:dTDP-4-amino-4,6-dideoxygalactose transaminase